jgi:hypothetical protein
MHTYVVEIYFIHNLFLFLFWAYFVLFYIIYHNFSPSLKKYAFIEIKNLDDCLMLPMIQGCDIDV